MRNNKYNNYPTRTSKMISTFFGVAFLVASIFCCLYFNANKIYNNYKISNGLKFANVLENQFASNDNMDNLNAVSNLVKTEAYTLNVSLASNSNETFFTKFNIINSNLKNTLAKFLEEKNTISVSLKFSGIEAYPIVFANTEQTLFTTNLGFISYISSGNLINPIYYVLDFGVEQSGLSIYHKDIPYENIKMIIEEMDTIDLIIKYID